VQAPQAAIFLALLFVFGAQPDAGAGPIHATVLFPTETIVTNTQFSPESVAVADFDGDGFKDVAVSSNVPSVIVWYRNNGNNTFDTTARPIVSFASFAVTNVVAANFDGDGDIDVGFWSGDQRVQWAENLGGTFNTTPRPVSGTANYDTSVAVGDVNGDGLPDLLSTTVFPDNTVAWYRNLGGGNFGFNPDNPTANRRTIASPAVSPSSIRATELDGDGITDLTVTSRNDGLVAWYRGAGAPPADPTFTRYQLPGSHPGAQDTGFADVNGDGWPEILCAVSGASALRWFRNATHDAVPAAPFFAAAQPVMTSVAGAWTAIPADLNTDGRPDVCTVALGGHQVLWCENLGGGNFNYNAGTPTSNQKIVSTAVSYPVAMVVADMNGDGVLDVVAASNGASKAATYFNQGGQCALAALATAPTTLKEGRRDDVLRLAVSNRGIGGDNQAQLSTLGLLFEKSAGVAMTTSEANLMVDSLHLYLDGNGSGLFESGADPLVASVADLSLTAGRHTFSLAGAVPANVQVAPGDTRTYFVVIEMGALASFQSPNTVRVTHLGSGTGRTVVKDAITAVNLTVEAAGSVNTASALITAQPANSYTDWSYISFDTAGTPGTGPLESQLADGIPNLLKYALVLDPVAGTAPAGLPAMLRQGSNRVLRHRKPSWAADLTYIYEVSRTLGAGSWSTAVEGVDYLKADSVVGTGVIQSDLTILGAWTKSFLRVRVQLAP
jgi:hypothetical protein